MDFIISLTPKAKEKLAGVSVNKSVAYLDQTVPEAEAVWALEMKRSIAEFLRHDSEGPFYLRMVETVLSRDKNWVRWKIENCPSIERPVISAQLFVESMDSIKRLTAKRKLRSTTMGAMSLDFLTAPVGLGTEGFEEPPDVTARFTAPPLQDFRGKLGDIMFDLEMEGNPSKRSRLEDRKAAVSWQAMRLAAAVNLPSFDRIETIDKLDNIYEPRVDADAEAEAKLGESGAPVKMPDDMKLVVITGHDGVGKEAILSALITKNPGVFKRVARHTTQPNSDTDVSGKFAHVDKKTFNVMVDGDQLLEFSEQGDFAYGTSRRVVTGITEGGKVPIVIVPYDSVQFIKDMGFEARNILIKAPNADAVEARAKTANVTDDKIFELVKTYTEAVAKDNYGEGFDIVLVNENDEETAAKILKFTYGEALDDVQEKTSKDGDKAEETNTDVNMDAPGASKGESNKENPSSASQSGTAETKVAEADAEVEDSSGKARATVDEPVGGKPGDDAVMSDPAGPRSEAGEVKTEDGESAEDTKMADA